METVNIDKPSLLITELNILANGKVIRGMDMENKNGLMVLNMKDIGKMTWHTVQEHSYTCTVISTKANGNVIKHMDKEFILIATELNIMENGKTIYNTDLVQRLGKINPNIKVSTKKAKSMV